MPVYEYRCEDCRRKSSVFYLTFTEATNAVPVCPHCASTHVRKLVSMFSAPKSEESRLDDIADPGAFGDVDENDPKSVARWARRMGRDMGEDLGPDYDEMVDSIERGEDPEGLGGMGPGGDMADDGMGDGLDDY
jgi:putative FmdB family regulatory protein